jgi:serine/threonine protein kinase/tetratricopeptide (TPR) repeat protein
MSNHGPGSSDRWDASGKLGMASVATPQSPGSPVPSSPLAPGSSTAGPVAPPETTPPAIPDHELLRCIGRGSYGEVWLARNVLGQYRAVKVIRRVHFESDHTYEREFEGLKRYEPVSRGDPSQVAVLHVGRQDDAGFYYYVMELADDAEAKRSDGATQKASTAAQHSITPLLQHSISYAPRTLKSDLARRKRLPLEECIEIGLALTTALEHLHGHGLIHRDIKPSNVIFIDGVPKLADIGLVATMDATMSFVGTAGYMPPEGPGKPTGDIYSLGKVLYEISVGRDTSEFPELPTAWESFAEQKQQLEFNAVVLKACAADPGQRYSTAREMHRDLALLREGKSVRRRQLVQRRWAASRRMALVGLLIAVFTLSAYALYRTFVGPREMVPASADHPVAVPLKASVFVLPFRSEGSNEVSADLCSRVTDAFIDSLALIEGVRRSPRKSGWAYQDENLLRNSLAQTNNVRHILTGRIMGEKDVLTLTLRLHKREEDHPAWTGDFSGTTNEVIALERRALTQIASVLGLRITGNEQQKIDLLLTNNLEALALMRQACATYQRKAGTQRGYTEVQTLAQKALEVDPRYLDAEHMMFYQTRVLSMDRPPVEAWSAVFSSMSRILEQDDTYADALEQLAGYILFYKRDWSNTYELNRREMQCRSGGTRLWLRAFWYRIHGWFEEARIAQQMSEEPEPTDIDQRTYMAAARWVDRRFTQGIQAARRTLELHPDNADAYCFLAHCLVANGEFESGLEAIGKAQRDWRRPEMIALKGYAYARMGQTNEVQKVLDELMSIERTGPYLQPYFVARVYAALGQNAKALDWLEKAEGDRSEYLFFTDFGGLRTDPAWDGLQKEPRFWQLCERLGLGKAQWPRPKPERMP